jgi:hypothetical protein
MEPRRCLLFFLSSEPSWVPEKKNFYDKGITGNPPHKFNTQLYRRCHRLAVW